MPLPYDAMGVITEAYKLAIQSLPGDESLHHPHICNLDMEFPEGDPMGQFSRLDMQFARRMEWLKCAAQIVSGKNGEILREFLQSSTDGIVSKWYTDAKDHSWTILKFRYTGELCSEEEPAKFLQEETDEMEKDAVKQDPEIQKIDKVLTLMEKIAGLRRGELNLDERRLYRMMFRKPLDPNIPTGYDVPRVMPETVVVNYQNLDNIIPLDGSGLGIQGKVERYAGATAHIVLTNLFGPIEINHKESRSPKNANRGTLVIVGDKTIREHIKAYYDHLPDEKKAMDYDKWYDKNVEWLSGVILSAGLMAGEPVEAYVPNSDGELPDKPVQLVKTGYEPHAERLEILKCWQRLWTKFGFGKEHTAEAGQREERMAAARERVKENYDRSLEEKQQSERKKQPEKQPKNMGRLGMGQK